MAYTLPFVSAGSQKSREKLRVRYDAQTDPMFSADPPPMPPPMAPSAPPPMANGSRAYTAWLAADQLQKDIQPGFPRQAPTMSQAATIEAFENDSPYEDERRTFQGLDSNVGRTEPMGQAIEKKPLTRTEFTERFPDGVSPEMERGLMSSGSLEPRAPTIKTNTYPWIADENRWEAPPMDEITDPGFEEFVRVRPWSAAELLEDDPRDQWVEYPVIDRSGTTTKKMMPLPLAQTLARRGGFGDQPSTSADFFDGLDWVARPFEVFAETVTEVFGQLPALLKGNFGDLEAPTLFTDGFVAAYEEFKDRPMWQQIVLGIVTDPAVMFKAFTISAKLARVGGRALSRADYIPIVDLFRAKVVNAAGKSGFNLSDDAADEIAGTLAAKMDEVIAAKPASGRQSALPASTEAGSARLWEEFLTRGEGLGRFSATSLTEQRAQWKALRDEYKLALDSGLNEHAAPLRGMDSVVD